MRGATSARAKVSRDVRPIDNGRWFVVKDPPAQLALPAQISEGSHSGVNNPHLLPRPRAQRLVPGYERLCAGAKAFCVGADCICNDAKSVCAGADCICNGANAFCAGVDGPCNDAEWFCAGADRLCHGANCLGSAAGVGCGGAYRRCRGVGITARGSGGRWAVPTLHQNSTPPPKKRPWVEPSNSKSSSASTSKLTRR